MPTDLYMPNDKNRQSDKGLAVFCCLLQPNCLLGLAESAQIAGALAGLLRVALQAQVFGAGGVVRFGGGAAAGGVFAAYPFALFVLQALLDGGVEAAPDGVDFALGGLLVAAGGVEFGFGHGGVGRF